MGIKKNKGICRFQKLFSHVTCSSAEADKAKILHICQTFLFEKGISKATGNACSKSWKSTWISEFCVNYKWFMILNLCTGNGSSGMGH